MAEPVSDESVTERIFIIRGERVILDADLARLYGVKTERLNQQVQRNSERFRSVFMFRLTQEEWRGMCLQFASTSQRRRRRDNLPYAFTEHGCLMLSNVLKSPRAVEVSILILQAFVRLRAVGKHDRKLAVHERAIPKILDMRPVPQRAWEYPLSLARFEARRAKGDWHRAVLHQILRCLITAPVPP